MPAPHGARLRGGRRNAGKAKFWDPLLEILSERGSVHERKFVEHLEQAGLAVSSRRSA